MDTLMLWIDKLGDSLGSSRFLCYDFIVSFRLTPIPSRGGLLSPSVVLHSARFIRFPAEVPSRSIHG
jgi:hypothetical protein